MNESPDHGWREAISRQGSFAQTFKAIFWAFFGVRKATDHAKDVAKINPVHVVLAGILGGVIFVLALVLVVQWVVSGHHV